MNIVHLFLVIRVSKPINVACRYFENRDFRSCGMESQIHMRRSGYLSMATFLFIALGGASSINQRTKLGSEARKRTNGRRDWLLLIAWTGQKLASYPGDVEPCVRFGHFPECLKENAAGTIGANWKTSQETWQTHKAPTQST